MPLLRFLGQWRSPSSTRRRRSRRSARPCTRRPPRCSTPGATSSARRSPPSRRSSPRYLGTPHAIGVANGTDALVLALRALGVGPGDDVVVPSFTFYASAEAIAVDRRAPRLLRHRPGDVLRHAGHGRARRSRRARARDGRAPVRQRRAGRRDRGARRARAGGRRAGGRLARRRRPPRRRARDARRRSPSSRPRTSARSATAARSRPRDAALAERVRMLRFHGSRDKVDVRARRPQLAPRRAAGRAPAAPAARTSTSGATAAARPPRTTRRPGWASTSTLPAAASTAAAPAWHLYVIRHDAARTSSPTALEGGRDRHASATTPSRCTGRRRCGRAAGAELPGTDEAARTPPRDPDEPGARPRAGGRGRRRREACASGST